MTNSELLQYIKKSERESITKKSTFYASISHGESFSYCKIRRSDVFLTLKNYPNETSFPNARYNGSLIFYLN